MSINQPGFEVIQRIATVSPTIMRPTLVPVCMGICNQVIEAYALDANGNQILNSSAHVSLPGILIASSAGPYLLLNTKTLIVSYKGGPAQTFTFVDNGAIGLTALQCKDQINSATVKPAGWAPYVHTSGASTYLMLKTVLPGDGEDLKVLGGTANSVFGFNDQFEVFGVGSYKNDDIYAAQTNFPDPRNLDDDDLDIDETTIRAFLSLGTTASSTQLQELKTTESFLRAGKDAVVAGGSAITFPTTTLTGKIIEATLLLGQAEKTYTFTHEYYGIDDTKIVTDAVLGAFPGTWNGEVLNFKVAGVSKSCTFVNPANADDVVDQINAAAGSIVCFRSTSAGVPAAAGNQITFQGGGKLWDGSTYIELINTGSTAWTNMGLTTAADRGSSLVRAINLGLGATVASENATVSDKLELASANGYLKVGDGTANTLLKLTDNTTRYAAAAVDDGDGDTLSPLLRFYGQTFSSSASAAEMTGTTRIGTPDIHKLDLIVGEDGNSNQTIEFDGGPIVPALVYNGAGLLVTDTLGMIVNGVAVKHTFTAAPAIAVAIAEINATAGQAVCYRSLQTGVADAAGTYIAFQVGGAVSVGGSIVLDISESTTDAWTALGISSPFASHKDIPQCLGNPLVSTNTVTFAALNTEILELYVGGKYIKTTFGVCASVQDAVDDINAAAAEIVCYPCTVAGVYDAAGTYIAFQVGGAEPTGGEVMAFFSDESTAWANIGFTGTVNLYQPLTALLAVINGTMGAGFAVASAGRLKMASAIIGDESKVELGLGTANTKLGLTDNDYEVGNPFPPAAADAVYCEGTFVGYILAAMPGGVGTDLKLDREVTHATYLKKYWYIQAREISSTAAGITRPTADLTINTAGDAAIKHDVVRDTYGEPITTALATLLLTYTGLRLDVTSRASSNPDLLTFETTTELQAALAPITTDNPLGLGMNFMMVNATSVECSGLGIDAKAADMAMGTLAAWQRAFTFLEAKEVYAIAPLTHDETVHGYGDAHIDKMNASDECGERIIFMCPEEPDRVLSQVIASGTDGDWTGANTFDTKVSGIAQALSALGINPAAIDASDGVYLDIALDAKNYNLSALSGTSISIRTSFSPGENDDSFYSITALPITLVSESFSILVRGELLLDTNGDPDFDAIATQYAALGQKYQYRKTFIVAPDEWTASVGGLSTLLPGYYMTAAIAGMVGQQPPQQPFTNFPILGGTSVTRHKRFTRNQLNTMAGGGIYWIIQDTDTSAIKCRHQLSTDVSSIERRELSITKVLDFVSKFMRLGLRSYIGRFNITQAFMDTIAAVIKGQLNFLIDAGILIGAEVSTIAQDANNPDTLLISIVCEIPYPCNYIRLTLVV